MWGYLFISPWIIGFFLFTLAPMIASLAFTFSNLALDQQEPLGFVGLATADHARRRPGLGVARGHLPVRAVPAAVHPIMPFLVALGLNSRYLGPGAFRILFFLPYVIPFVSGVLIWQGMLNLETGWVNSVPRFLGIQTRPTGSTTAPFDLSGLVMIGIWGIGAGHHRQPGRPARHPDGAVRRRAHRRRGGWWASLRPRDAAADVADHLLHADPRGRRRPPVLPRPAGHQQRHGRAGRHHHVLQPATCTRTSSRTRTWPTERRSPGCCSS